MYYTSGQRHRQSMNIKNRYVCLVKMHNAVNDNFIVTIFLSKVSNYHVNIFPSYFRQVCAFRITTDLLDIK